MFIACSRQRLRRGLAGRNELDWSSVGCVPAHRTAPRVKRISYKHVTPNGAKTSFLPNLTIE